MARNKKSEYRRSLDFAAILAGLGVAFAILSLFRNHWTRSVVFAGVGLGALALALIAKPLWLLFFRAWMRLAEGMGWVMTGVVLSVFYFLVLTPFGLVLRLTGNPTLDTAWRDGKPSYWIDKEPVEPSMDRYSKRF